MASTTTIINSISISDGPEKIFDLVTTPGLWPRWHPSSRHLNGADQPLKKGATFSEDIKAGGRSGKLSWEVIVCNRPLQWIAKAESTQGARIHLQYDLEKAASTVAFKRTITYELSPLLLQIANAIFMRRRIERESAQALQNLKLLVETGVSNVS